MTAFYNEINPFAAAWLRELIKAGLIAPGVVDERPIQELTPKDVEPYTQCHFFAGIGGWSYALRQAGWSDDRAVWTGSCPCQPFSIAGQHKGITDKRHLWPYWFPLIDVCRPTVVFGEQVAGADGCKWLARVHLDLEDKDYLFGAADLCAAGEAAPHVRQRYFFVADANSQRRIQSPQARSKKAPRQWHRNDHQDRLVDTNGGHGFWWSGPLQVGRNAIEAEVERGGRRYRAQWRIKPGLSLLAYGVPGRVELIRGYGNAIVPQVAATFIKAYLEASGMALAQGLRQSTNPVYQGAARTMAKTETRGRMSTRRADATAGGAIEGAVAKVTELEYVSKFKYQNGQQGGAAVRAVYAVDGLDKPWEQHYSLGDTDRYEVVEDGDAIEGKLNKNSNGFRFFDALESAIEDAGLDYDDLLPHGSVAPLREFFEAGNMVRLTNVKYVTVGGDDKEVPVIGAIVVSAKAGKSNGKANGKSRADDVVDELEVKTIGIIEQILSRADGPVKFAELPEAIFALCKKDPEVRAMRQWASSEKNVSAEDRPWTYNAKKRTLEAS